MTRQELIDKGKVWQVHPDGNVDCIFFEGTKTQCRNYIKDKNMKRMYKKGEIRLGKLIWENKN